MRLPNESMRATSLPTFRIIPTAVRREHCFVKFTTYPIRSSSSSGKSPRVSPGLATAGHGDAATLLLKGNVLAVGGSDNYAHPTVNAKTYA